MNTQILIGRYGATGFATLTNISHGEILQSNAPATFRLQISKSGNIKLFSKRDHTQFQLIASATDYRPIRPEYASFASFDSVNNQFWFECTFPPQFIDSQLASKSAIFSHPLLNDPVISSPIDKRNCEWLLPIPL